MYVIYMEMCQKYFRNIFQLIIIMRKSAVGTFSNINLNINSKHLKNISLIRIKMIVQQLNGIFNSKKIVFCVNTVIYYYSVIL